MCVQRPVYGRPLDASRAIIVKWCGYRPNSRPEGTPMPKPASRPRSAATAAPEIKAAPTSSMIAPIASTVTPASEIQAFGGDPNFMASLARGLAVIRAFTQQRRHLTIAQLSQRTGIPRAAVRRCLYTLAKLGYVASDDGRTYALRPRILALGHAYLSSTPLANAVQPLLDQITSELHESSSMAVLEGDDILYIARSSTTTRVMSIDLGIGSRLPAYCTSMGRVLLAGLPDAEMESRFLPPLRAAAHELGLMLAR